MRMMRKSVAHATGMHGFFSGKHESESDSDHTSPLIGPPGSSVTRSGSVVIPIARATSPPGPDEVKEVDAQGPRSLAAAMENAAADNSPLPARQRFSSAARDTQQSALSLQSARSSQSAPPQPFSHRHSPLGPQTPWTQPAHVTTLQSAPAQPLSQRQPSTVHLPRPEQPLSQTRFWHAIPA